MPGRSETTFLKLLLEVSSAITSSLDPDKVIGLITSKIPQVMNVDAVTVRLLDAAGEKLVLRAAFGLSDQYLNRGAIDTEEPIFKALRGEPIVIENATQDQRINYPEATRQEGIKSILVVPIVTRGKISGILRLLTRSSRSYNQDEIDFAAALGEQCGISIENARIFKDQEIQLTYFKAIHEIGKMVNATYDLDKILNLIVTRLPAVMNLKAATVRLIEGPKSRLELKAAYGLSQAYLERGPLDDELATYYIKEGDPVVITDARKDIHTLYHKAAENEGIGSILAVPIVVKDEVIGILRLLTSEQRYFSNADINFALAVAEQGGVAIQRSIDFTNLKRQ
jgi:GAF domain-containing protein